MVDPQILEGVERFNPEHLSELEATVREQENSGKLYDLNLNLAVLKLYQFNPQMAKADIIVQILRRAVTALPDNDFTLCQCLLDEATLEDPRVVKLTQLQEHLEHCDFRSFWRAAEAAAQDLQLDNFFYDSVREYVRYAIQSTYQTITVENFAALLNYSPERALAHVRDDLHWEVIVLKSEDGRVVVKVPTFQEPRFANKGGVLEKLPPNK